eukprot:CAMPEP_0170516410 /NCGR_PEP_ID=MMETSP0209-20121228/2625_1 /TAXON_ID=665100 ORGANISM="Litonotus pictus, Strain P1" /NCGR_SAMPLE_ID=MMETSP0209 /ASSEMBLY_ACC=CAM_ASM_000301 /LENGTH=425 /DNA_ID=CAMNT_0010801277 /DNA_START=227 /DNA_END=1501 /DNA_ORIENTATION=+
MTKNLLHLEAKMTAMEEETSINLKIHRQQKTDQDFHFYDFTFRSEPMNYEEERLIVITEYYSNQFDLLPKKIALIEDQFVTVDNTQNLISFYETQQQRTKIKLPVSKNKVLTYTQENAILDKDRLIYTHNEPVEPFRVIPFKTHFECNFSLVIFNSVEKIHEVSHWGNIAVEEKYQIENIGAKLVGEFGRVDYDDNAVKGGRNALRSLSTVLPLRANNLWYRDEIGNISSSKAFRDWDDVKMDLELRFPLLGGWKSNFMIGYSLPTKFHADVDDEGNTKLNLTYGIGFDDILAKNYTFKIILPEHSTVSKVTLPIEASYKVTYEKSFSFLDLFGRTTVVITMNNLFDIHHIPVEIEYNFNSAWLLFKPFLLVGFFALVFMVLIVYNRIEISLNSEEKSMLSTSNSESSGSADNSNSTRNPTGRKE